MREPQDTTPAVRPSESRRSPRVSSVIKIVIQTAITAGVLVWIFSDVELRDRMSRTLHDADWPWLGIGLIAAALWIAASVYRWWLFLRVQGVQLTMWRILCIYLISMFGSLVLPGAFSAGAVRVVYVMRERPNRKMAATLSVVTDHLSGLVALLLIAMVFTFSRSEALRGSPIAEGMMVFLAGFFAVVFAGLAATFISVRTGFIDTIPRRVPGRDKLIEFARALSLFVVAWRTSLAAVGVSMIVLGGYFTTFYCAGRAFGAHLSLADTFLIMPIVDVIAAMPVTVSGLGVREKLFQTLLRTVANVPGGVAVLISLTGFAFSAAWFLLGALVFPYYRHGAALDESPAVNIETASKECV